VNAIATIRDMMTKAVEATVPVSWAGTIDISFAITQTRTISLGLDGELANELTHNAARRALREGRRRPTRSLGPALQI
jgi:hypothetical protein